MEVLIVVAMCIFLYGCWAGVSWALVRWHQPNAEEAAFFAALLWPIALPAILTNALTKRLMSDWYKRKLAAEHEAEDLKRRVAELDKEMRASRGTN